MQREEQITRISKFLSLVLRHKPDTIGIHLDTNGWTNIEFLLEQMNKNGFNISRELLLHVVETNAKKRFALSDDKSLIRASQGHSIEIELGYKPQQPPEILYHGTAESSLSSILGKGLEKRSRQHVHLSSDIETALKVGQRHGKPVVLSVSAGKMFRDGLLFSLSENNVWLTDRVPPEYLSAIK